MGTSVSCRARSPTVPPRSMPYSYPTPPAVINGVVCGQDAALISPVPEPASVLELGRDLVLPRIDPAGLHLREPPVPLRRGQPPPAPGAEPDPEVRRAAVVHDEPVLPEPGAERHHRVRAVVRILVPVTVPVQLTCHLLTAVRGHELIFP